MINRMPRAPLLPIMFMLSKNKCLRAATKVSDWVRLLRMNRRLTKISKYLSFILRHHPEKIGLKLDHERWASLEELVEKANSNGKSFTVAQVLEVVEQNEQKIFVVSDDGLRIRCS